MQSLFFFVIIKLPVIIILKNTYPSLLYLESWLPGELAITSDMQMAPPLTAESEEELKSLSKKVKEESEKLA